MLGIIERGSREVKGSRGAELGVTDPGGAVKKGLQATVLGNAEESHTGCTEREIW